MQSPGRIVASKSGHLYRSSSQLSSLPKGHVLVHGDASQTQSEPDGSTRSMARMSQQEGPHSSNGHTLSTPDHTLWTPSLPIVFADMPRTIRRDFTWKRGDHVIFGPGCGQHRTYATKKSPVTRPLPPTLPKSPKSVAKSANPNDLILSRASPSKTAPKPAPKPYHPPAPKTTAKPANPNDLSFLEPSPRRSPQSSAPSSGPASALSSSPSLVLSSNPSSRRTSEPSAPSALPQPLRNQDAPPSRTNEHSPVKAGTDAASRQEVAAVEKPAPLDNAESPPDTTSSESRASALDVAAQRLVSAVEIENANAIRMLRKELATMAALTASQKRKIDGLETRLQNQKLDVLRDVAVADSKREVDELRKELRNTKRERLALVASNKDLAQELEHARDPKDLWRRRLALSKENQNDQDEKNRQLLEKSRRIQERATYSSFQDFFNTGLKETGRWLNNDVKTQNKFHLRAKAYWQKASWEFDAYAENIRGRDDFRFWELTTAAHEKALSVKEIADHKNNLEVQIKHRNHIFARLSDNLQQRSHESHCSATDFDDVVWDFQNYTWSALKTHAHTARHFVHLMRYAPGGSMGQLNRQYFRAARGESVSRPMLEVQKSLARALRFIQREKTREKNPDEFKYLTRRRHAIAAKLDLAKILREVEMREIDLVESRWMIQQPLATSAVTKETLPLFSVQAELRPEVERLVQDLNTLGLDNRQTLLKVDGLYKIMELIEELQLIVYRNNLLAEKHSRLSDAQTSILRTFSLQQYQDSLSDLKALLHADAPRSSSRISGLFPLLQSYSADINTRRLKRQSDKIDALNEAASLQNLTEGSLTEDERRAVSWVPPAKTTASVTNTYELVVGANEQSLQEFVDENIDLDDSTLPDSPMDFFENPKSTLPLDDAPIDTIPSQQDNMDEVLESTKTNVDTGSSGRSALTRSRPSYTLPKRRGGESNAAADMIQPHKGVLPKPDYGLGVRGGRRRPFFKPTKARRNILQTHPDGIMKESLVLQGDSEPKSADSDEVREVHVPLAFQIPSEDLRNALIASKASGASFWKHSLYKGPSGEKVNIHYCTNFEAAEKQARLFLDETVLGFDAEWEPNKSGFSSIKEHMSLIQIASESRIALFQIASFQGSTAEALMPPSLRIILESPRIIKAGVNISGDYTRLNKCFGIQGQGLFELSHLYKIVKYAETDPTKIDRKLSKMADQVQEFLFLPLAKGAVRTSAWSRRLTKEQVEYAASDAYAGFRLFDALEARRKAMTPTPPRPALYELHKPLILGNGRPPPRKAKNAAIVKPSTKTSEASIAKDQTAVHATGAEEDSNTAVDEEEDQSVEDAVATIGQDGADESEGSDDEYFSCESDRDDTTDDDFSQISNPQTQPRFKGPSSVGSEPSPQSQDAAQTAPIELIKAERWLAQWQANTVGNRKMPVYLRAYALWYSQSLGLGEVAALLRQPPLARTSVAQYILDAVKHEDLPFKVGRLQEVLDYVPPSAYWRYSRTIEKLREIEGAEGSR